MTNKVRIDIRQNIELASVAGRQLLGDLYLPEPTATADHPAVILIFGGGWRTGERSQQKIYGLALAKAGFVCLAADYRWSTEALWPAQLDDVKAAVRWLRTHAADWRVDPARIAISGNSSGGHLALMTAATADDSASVSAVCAFYPPTDLASLGNAQNDDVRALLGDNASTVDYEQASPLSFAAKPQPPTLLLSSSDDQRVPVEQTYRLHQSLESAGNTVELHVFAGQGHAFDAELEFAQLSAEIMVNFFSRYA